MNIAVILAGGVGARLGADKPKQFIEVLGKPVLFYTIEKFQNHPEIDAIEIVCLESYQESLKKMVADFGLSKVRWMVAGGKNFQESVMQGVFHLKGKCQAEDILLVHYGVSPFVSEEIITDAIRVARRFGNCTSATPIYLLTGSNDDGKKSTKLVDRDAIMGLNSPQTFTYGYISQLYQEAIETGAIEKAEPHTTSLMYEMGRTIYFSKGNQSNIKITTKEDLDLLEGYILLQERRKKK